VDWKYAQGGPEYADGNRQQNTIPEITVGGYVLANGCDNFSTRDIKYKGIRFSKRGRHQMSRTSKMRLPGTVVTFRTYEYMHFK
jgi:hypothetical protein